MACVNCTVQFSDDELLKIGKTFGFDPDKDFYRYLIKPDTDYTLTRGVESNLTLQFREVYAFNWFEGDISPNLIDLDKGSPDYPLFQKVVATDGTVYLGFQSNESFDYFTFLGINQINNYDESTIIHKIQIKTGGLFVLGSGDISTDLINPTWVDELNGRQNIVPVSHDGELVMFTRDWFQNYEDNVGSVYDEGDDPIIIENLHIYNSFQDIGTVIGLALTRCGDADPDGKTVRVLYNFVEGEPNMWKRKALVYHELFHELYKAGHQGDDLGYTVMYPTVSDRRFQSPTEEEFNEIVQRFWDTPLNALCGGNLFVNAFFGQGVVSNLANIEVDIYYTLEGTTDKIQVAPQSTHIFTDSLFSYFGTYNTVKWHFDIKFHDKATQENIILSYDTENFYSKNVSADINIAKNIDGTWEGSYSQTELDDTGVFPNDMALAIENKKLK